MKVSFLTASLPDYRRRFVRSLRGHLGENLEIMCGDTLLDRSVATNIDQEDFTRIRNIRLLGGRLYLHYGSTFRALRSHTVIVDLNPRCLTSWLLLLLRLPTRRRTLLWGHVFPRSGPLSRTESLRRMQRSLADGIITYTEGEGTECRARHPGKPVYIAHNGIYSADEVLPTDRGQARNVLYVGRLVAAKKPALLLQAFADCQSKLPEECQLVFVGAGAELDNLKDNVARLGISDRVRFTGHVSDLPTLRAEYESSFAAVSPGYAGLSVTQALGFGVPIVIADNEPHAPEIELARSGSFGAWFTADSAEALSERILEIYRDRSFWSDEANELSRRVRCAYTSEAMARGFVCAIEGRPAA